jgi:CDP-diacylglycerol--glycerol-3-phosphate 3-phosphatidyltransferase
MLDGKIARKHGLITDFGKFLDPLADKFMVISAMMCIMYRSHSETIIFNVFMVLVMVTVFRELAVASIRLIAAKNANIVVAANMLGKIKTVSQIVFICTALLEPVVEFVLELLLGGADEYILHGVYPLTWASMVFTLVMTLWSGINYIKAYWKYLDPEK